MIEPLAVIRCRDPLPAAPPPRNAAASWRPVVDWFDARPRLAALPGRGLLTAGDAAVFPGLRMLLASARGLTLAVVDLGLTPDQRADLAAGGARLLPTPPLAVSRGAAGWQSWNKPLYLQASPFAATLWLDSDCLLLGDPRLMWDRAERWGLAVVRHRHCWQGLDYVNSDAVYRRRPVARTLKSDDLPINAGVVAVVRGDPTLAEWAAVTHEAAASETLRGELAYWDEGALHWAIERVGRPDLVVADRSWNRLVWERPADAAALVAELAGSTDMVRHYCSSPKVWDFWAGRRDAPNLLGVTGGKAAA